jgi:hypothetical protein
MTLEPGVVVLCFLIVVNPLHLSYRLFFGGYYIN